MDSTEKTVQRHICHKTGCKKKRTCVLNGQCTGHSKNSYQHLEGTEDLQMTQQYLVKHTEVNTGKIMLTAKQVAHISYTDLTTGEIFCVLDLEELLGCSVIQFSPHTDVKQEASVH